MHVHRSAFRFALVLAAGAACFAAAGASVATAEPASSLIQIAGYGSSVWIVEQAGSHLALWSRTRVGSWKPLSWPSPATTPISLARLSPTIAYVATSSRQIYLTVTGGVSWRSMRMPALVRKHPRGWQGMQLSQTGPSSEAFTLLAWGPEAAYQSTKMLWRTSNAGKTWIRIARSTSASPGFRPSWWPHNPTPSSLPSAGDPMFFLMFGAKTGYLASSTAGRPILWKTADGGATWAPANINGMLPRNEAPGISVSGAQLQGNSGWLTALGPEVIRLTRQQAQLIPVPSAVGNDYATSFTSTTSGSVIDRVHQEWHIFNTTNAGRDWTTLSLSESALPPNGDITQAYRAQNTLWVFVDGHLYAGPVNRAAAWKAVTLPL